MTCPYYYPVIKAEFGKTIGDIEINNEFQAIETSMACISGELESSSDSISNSIDLGTITNETIIDTSDALVQYMTVEGDVDIDVKTPGEDDPRLITLVIADGGAGRFNFPVGSAWASNANGTSMDGMPWDNDGLGGDYGAIVTCIYDGSGWVFIVYSRHDIDFTASPDVADIYRWR